MKMKYTLACGADGFSSVLFATVRFGSGLHSNDAYYRERYIRYICMYKIHIFHTKLCKSCAVFIQLALYGPLFCKGCSGRVDFSVIRPLPDCLTARLIKTLGRGT